MGYIVTSTELGIREGHFQTFPWKERFYNTPLLADDVERGFFELQSRSQSWDVYPTRAPKNHSCLSLWMVRIKASPQTTDFLMSLLPLLWFQLFWPQILVSYNENKTWTALSEEDSLRRNAVSLLGRLKQSSNCGLLSQENAKIQFPIFPCLNCETKATETEFYLVGLPRHKRHWLQESVNGMLVLQKLYNLMMIGCARNTLKTT